MVLPPPEELLDELLDELDELLDELLEELLDELDELLDELDELLEEPPPESVAPGMLNQLIWLFAALTLTYTVCAPVGCG